MSDQNHAPRFGCPQCGDDRIREWHILGGWCAVTEWNETGAPLDFDGHAEVIWDAQRAANPERGEGDRYICDNGHMFNQPVRLDVDPAPTFPATGPRFGCPSCKSENITDDDFILRRRKVERWTEDGEPEVHGDAHIETDTGDVPDDRFTCEDCGAHFMDPVRLDPEPDAEEEARREHRRAAKERGTL